MIEIASVAGLSTVQDGGRPGHMHEGVPPGGALVPALLARANRAASNADGEAGIEVFGSLTLVARAPVLVATDAGDAHALALGEPLAIASAGARVRYVALRGGVDVPRVLGGRGTLLAGAFGGLGGRPLRKGDRLGAARAAPGVAGPALDWPDPAASIHIVPGPDLERFAPGALEVLLRGAFEVSPRSDRVGARLCGPTVPRADADAAVSGPMVRGAIQVPSSGEPIVLGPDHPTTGGYPVIATVLRAELGALMARPVGALVRFAVRPA